MARIDLFREAVDRVVLAAEKALTKASGGDEDSALDYAILANEASAALVKAAHEHKQREKSHHGKLAILKDEKTKRA